MPLVPLAHNGFARAERSEYGGLSLASPRNGIAKLSEYGQLAQHRQALSPLARNGMRPVPLYGQLAQHRQARARRHPKVDPANIAHVEEQMEWEPDGTRKHCTYRVAQRT